MTFDTNASTTLAWSVIVVVAVGCAVSTLANTTHLRCGAQASAHAPISSSAPRPSASKPDSASVSGDAKFAIVATAAEPIHLFRSGNGLLALSVNGDPEDFESRRPPTIAHVRENCCELLGGDKDLPSLDWGSLNDDPKRRWGFDSSSPLGKGPSNGGERIVAGAGTIREGTPWIAIRTVPRYRAMNAMDLFLRVNARWIPVWSIQTPMRSFVAASNVDESADVDIVAIESSAPSINSPFRTFVRELRVLESKSRPPSVSATKVELDCFSQPSELLATGAHNVLGIGTDLPEELYFEQIDLVTRRATRTRFAGLLKEGSSWGVQVSSSESITLWRKGAPATRFARTGNEFSMATDTPDDSRVQRLLATYPSATEVVTMPNGRLFAQVRISDSEWQLVSDQPVESPCVFPWRPNP